MTIKNDCTFGARRMNPEIETRVTSEKRREPSDERLNCAKLKLWTLIAAGVTFTPRRMQDVED
jgi:hypothetical protein